MNTWIGADGRCAVRHDHTDTLSEMRQVPVACNNRGGPLNTPGAGL